MEDSSVGDHKWVLCPLFYISVLVLSHDNSADEVFLNTLKPGFDVITGVPSFGC
jgi:hypothetical protein